MILLCYLDSSLAKDIFVLDDGGRHHVVAGCHLAQEVYRVQGSFTDTGFMYRYRVHVQIMVSCTDTGKLVNTLGSVLVTKWFKTSLYLFVESLKRLVGGY